MTDSFAPDAGRAVIVTGAGKGLGAAFAAACAARGDRVLVNNRISGDGPPSADTHAAALRARGWDAVADTHAVDAPGAAEAIVAAALAAFGRLDALILNAGIAGPAAKLPDLGEAALREVMAINFFANAALVDAALPHLLAAPAGRIVFVSSTGGLHGVRGRSAYAASKGALTAYALSLADEQRRGSLRVNILCPYAATAMTGGLTADARLAPDGAAAAAAWLTSSACTATGQIWVAGAGHARRAAAVESRNHAAASPDWFAAHADGVSVLDGAADYPGGDAAFRDFHASLGTCR